MTENGNSNVSIENAINADVFALKSINLHRLAGLNDKNEPPITMERIKIFILRPILRMYEMRITVANGGNC